MQQPLLEYDYTEEEFWSALFADLDHAHTRVLIMSGFVAVPRIKKILPTLQKVRRRGAIVCVFFEKPGDWNEDPRFLGPEARLELQQVKTCIEMLCAIGVHINLLPKVHKKIVIIDEDIAYTGSLNPLSHNKKSEGMTRWVSEQKVQTLIRMHMLISCNRCRKNRSKLGLVDPDKLDPESYGTCLTEQLTQRRNLLGIAQGELAKNCVLQQAALSRIEQGKRAPSFKNFLRICFQLGLVPVLVPRSLIPAVTQLLTDAEKADQSSNRL